MVEEYVHSALWIYFICPVDCVDNPNHVLSQLLKLLYMCARPGLYVSFKMESCMDVRSDEWDFWFLKRQRNQLREGSISRSKRTNTASLNSWRWRSHCHRFQFACLRSFRSPNVADINTGNENQWSNQLTLRNSNSSFDFELEKLIWLSGVLNPDEIWVGRCGNSKFYLFAGRQVTGWDLHLIQTSLIQEDSSPPLVELCFYFDTTSSENG